MGQGKITKFTIGGIPVESVAGTNVPQHAWKLMINGDEIPLDFTEMKFTWEFAAPSRPVPDDPNVIEGRCRVIEDDEPQPLALPPGDK